jgi:beta-galactosidase
MVQVENEFGSYGDVSTNADDRRYLEHLITAARTALGPSALLFTTDGGSEAFMRRGSLRGPAVLTVGDGCTNPEATWAAQRAFNLPGGSPFLCAELYPGWLTHWGEAMANTSSADAASRLDAVLSAANGTGSANLYMAHGGTSFGWWAGANGDGRAAAGGTYQPDITSYDYDAPISEGGEHGWGSDGVDKYVALASVLERHRPAGTPPPPPEPPMRPRAALGAVRFVSSARLLPQVTRMAPAAAASGETTPPPALEPLRCWGGGHALYEATLTANLTRTATLTLPRLHDRALVFSAPPSAAGVRRPNPMKASAADAEVAPEGSYLGTISRAEPSPAGLALPPLPAGGRVTILLELLGRINFSRGMDDARFGLLGGVLLEGSARPGSTGTGAPATPAIPLHATWTVRCLPLTADQLGRLSWEPLGTRRDGPAFYRANFSSASAGVDTYLRLRGFTKGAAWVNGFALGRHWEVRGPQQALYVPGPLVQRGENELVVLELHNASANATAELVDHPVWRTPS